MTDSEASSIEQTEFDHNEEFRGTTNRDPHSRTLPDYNRLVTDPSNERIFASDAKSMGRPTDGGGYDRKSIFEVSCHHSFFYFI